MKHRGRHRRRRRGQALRATLAGTALALTAAATLISTSQATGSNSPGALTPLTSVAETSRLQLHENLVAGDTLSTLSRNMGGNVGVSGVLASADHTMRGEADCSGTERAALPLEPVATRAYCWASDDARSRQWAPASVTTSGDAEQDGRWGDRRVILAGWNHDDRAAGASATDRGLARVAFIDASDPAALRYRWVLLVAPRDGGKDFGAVRSRLGGMVWYQGKLIVTAQNGAGRDDSLLVFDLQHLLKAGVDSGAIGKVRGGYSAHGYQYVLPAVGSYSPAGGTCGSGEARANPCFGSLSLDRTSTPDSLVATEAAPADGTERTRIWRYSYSTGAGRAGLLGSDSLGRVDAREAYTTKAAGLSGVLSYTPAGARKADWYVGHTPASGGRHGTLWRQSGHTAEAVQCTGDQSYACWGQHAASLSYWQETGELWTLTGAAPDTTPERVLYAVPLTAVNKSLG
ncbi:hypothetical protein FNV65_39530 [Streptomyces sp. S1A1-8]|uniref:hypothetical protein n=1 Tax=unclassified Streptomyces TaxID=2593676 RepID=UPI0011625F3D|nr:MULTISPECIES: hypothetical protein [unclassified Streptomyces]QDO01522.1 hypothetical protein FNV58_40955 [Streptomyces sp. RLB1-9]QDO23253.1 hypothetical protein FNV65_39530 [Streptomyces sp. S1A1-8]QDO33379.1 hypothetical protein FNV63_39555 [Streptomyces sp. S1A1-3]